MVKKQKWKGMEYSKLANSTKERLGAFLRKAHLSGNTLAELRAMDNKEFVFQLKIKNTKSNISANRKLLNQTQKTELRREGSIKRILPIYKKNGYHGKGLKNIENQLIRTSSNVFSAISKAIYNKPEFQKIKNKDIRKRESEWYTKELLAIPKRDRVNLKDAFDYDLLDMFSN
jgi:hypothetical protein